jgi:hypothetical protein
VSNDVSFNSKDILLLFFAAQALDVIVLKLSRMVVDIHALNISCSCNRFFQCWECQKFKIGAHFYFISVFT